MIDKNLRDLERLQNQDSLRLKLLQRRLGQSVYIQETPRPIQVFNSTELIIDIKSVVVYQDGLGVGSGSGNECGDGEGDGDGHGYGDSYASGVGWGDGDGHGVEYGWGDGSGYGFGYGSEYGKSEDSYTDRTNREL
jgi:hypothetical protein